MKFAIEMLIRIANVTLVLYVFDGMIEWLICLFLLVVLDMIDDVGMMKPGRKALQSSICRESAFNNPKKQGRRRVKDSTKASGS